MPSFVEKLRMQNIFGGAGLGPPQMAQPLDMGAMMQNVQNENDLERQHEIQLAGMRAPQIRQIAQRSIAPEKPMNVVFNPGISEFQRGTLASRSADRTSRENIASGRLGLGDRQIQGRADLLDTRGDQVMDQIGARGDIGSRQIQERGDIRTDQIDQQGKIRTGQIDQQGKIASGHIQDRGKIQEGIQETRGTQGLASIAARGRETRLTDDSKAGKGELPTQVKVRQGNAARELMNTRPDLANFVQVDDKGNVTIAPNEEAGFFSNASGPTPEQRKQIESIIYAARPEPSTPKYNNSGKVVKKVQVTKGGKKYNLPEDQVKDALAEGYKLVN